MVAMNNFHADRAIRDSKLSGLLLTLENPADNP